MTTSIFKKPTSGLEGSYDIQPGSTSVWRVRINEGQHGSIVLTSAEGLSIASNNPGIVPNDAAVFERKALANGSVQLRFYGLAAERKGPGTAMLEARRSGSVVAYMQIQVQSIGGKRAFFQLDQPQMALNATDSPVKYAMKYSETIPRSLSPSEIISRVLAKGSLQHLVLSCHGQPTAAAGAYFELGTGFYGSDVEQFKRLYPSVQQVIWIGACSICGTEEGIDYCKRMAKLSGCFVVAPAITLPPLKTGINQIEVFTRSLPHYFDRDGNLITQRAFLQLGSELGFRMIRVQG